MYAILASSLLSVIYTINIYSKCAIMNGARTFLIGATLSFFCRNVSCSFFRTSGPCLPAATLYTYLLRD
jgi:hypothetical protein